ncbi:hypothetical protein ACA910_019513 [Epithemia clementina (nom. ined.)]
MLRSLSSSSSSHQEFEQSREVGDALAATQELSPPPSTNDSLSQIRRRRRSPNTTTTTSPTTYAAANKNKNNDWNPLPPQYAAGLRVANLMQPQASAQHFGTVYKLHLPVAFVWLPQLVQLWLLQHIVIVPNKRKHTGAAATTTVPPSSSRPVQQSSSSSSSSFAWWQRLLHFLLASWLLPYWNSRFLILVGRYLYKFTSDQDQEAPKGRPIALEGATFYSLKQQQQSIEDDDEDTDTPSSMSHHYHDNQDFVAAHMPPPPPTPVPSDVSHGASRRGTILVVETTLYKKQYYAVNDNEALVWMDSLRQAQAEAVRRQMGHAPRDSYPPAWRQLDQLGDQLVQTHDRLQHARDRPDSSSHLFPELELVTTNSTTTTMTTTMDQGYWS